MLMRLITQRRRIAHAQAAVRRQLMAEATRTGRITLGYQGGRGNVAGAWFESLDMFFGYWKLSHDGRYWNAFGFGNPFEDRNVSIVVEVNPPFEGIQRDVAGAFAEDDDGTVCLVHRGKIGGGRKGIGKAAFVAANERRLVPAIDGEAQTDVIVVGAIDDPALVPQIADFVSLVQRFKDRAVGKSPKEKPRPAKTSKTGYSPEFSGVKAYQTKSEVVSRVTHGIVVEHLRSMLRDLGHRVGNDQSRDLFVLGKGNQVRVLFEAKTDSGSTSVYTALGQLLFHRSSAGERMVAVFPDDLDGSTGERLQGLGVEVVKYSWKRQKPAFVGLREAVR